MTGSNNEFKPETLWAYFVNRRNNAKAGGNYGKRNYNEGSGNLCDRI